MFSATVISCVFWFTEECHVSVIQEMSIPSIGDIYTMDTSDSGKPIAMVSTPKTRPIASAADAESESYYDSYFSIDLQAIIQAFVPFSGKSDATHSQPFEQAVAMVPQDDLKELLAERQPQPTFDKQDDVDVRWAQQSFLEAMLARGHDSPKQDDSDFSEQDDSDVRMAQKYFEEMLAEPTTTTTSLSFLSKFDRFDGQTCSLRKNEPLASYHSSAMSANIDPSLCARACLAVNDCSGFRIFQFRGLMYCDLMSTCTEDRLQMVSSKSLSTFLLRPVKDATRNPSFDYYYQYEATGGYFVPIMLMFAIVCFALVACRIKRRRRLLAARAAARRHALRSTELDTDKDRDDSDPEIVVIGRSVEPQPPPRPSQTQRACKKEQERECQDF